MDGVTICSDFGVQKNKVSHCFHYFPIYLPLSDATRCHDLRFLNVELQASFFTLLLFSSRSSLVPLHFLPLGWCHLHIWGYWYFSMKSWFQLSDFCIKTHTHMPQINLLTLWHNDYFLFIEWKWIFIEVFILIVFMLSKLRRRRSGWSCCLRGIRGGRGGGRRGRRGKHLCVTR